jgi:hypothetical protein
VAALNKFRSSAPDVADSLKGIFELCSSLEFDVVAQWKPRGVEDALSRVPDASDWSLAPSILSSICQAFGTPTADLFASDVWHVAPTFVTPRYMPGCAAVDAHYQDWRNLIGNEGLA